MSRTRLTRRSALGVVVVISVVFGAGGFLGAHLVRSPQEAAASRKPPAPSVLTAPVVLRRLVDKLVTRGDVVVGRRVDVALLGAGDARPVITGVRVHPGESVRSGDVVVEVSGRPMTLLTGRVPAYRDLRPGAHGTDVRQLQGALGAAGYPTGGDPLGTLGTGTQHALSRFYAAIGYDVPTTGNEADVASGTAAVKAARRAVAAARLVLRRVRAQSPDPTDPRAHQYAVQDARTALGQAAGDLRDAENQRAGTLRVSGPMLPLNEFSFVPGLPATVASVTAKVGAPGEGTALSLDLGVPRVQLTLDPTRSDLVRTGMPVSVFVDNLGKTFAGTVAQIGPESDDGSGGLGHRISIACPGLSRSSVGANVRVTATTAATEDAVLVVPLAAVTTSADGETTVVLRDDSGNEHSVGVRPGMSAGGFVEIAPAARAHLAPGDRVVVGDG